MLIDKFVGKSIRKPLEKFVEFSVEKSVEMSGEKSVQMVKSQLFLSSLLNVFENISA